jgi:hypothetical protein
MPGFRRPAVYYRAMGLFRRLGRKNRRTPAAEIAQEQTETVKAQAEVPRREPTAEARPNPDEPGWGRIIGHELGRARENRPARNDNGSQPFSAG